MINILIQLIFLVVLLENLNIGNTKKLKFFIIAFQIKALITLIK